MVWGKAGSTTLTSTGGTITVSGMTPSKMYESMICKLFNSGSVQVSLQFNNDTGTNYADRGSVNGGTDSPLTNQQNIFLSHGSENEFVVFDMVNISGKEKLIISHLVNQNTDGAGNPPSRRELVGKAVITSQITEVDVNVSSLMAIGSNLSVLGSDATPAAASSLTISDGVVFYETDTNKSYVLSSNTWTEL